jgi:hypothetical protein
LIQGRYRYARDGSMILSDARRPRNALGQQRKATHEGLRMRNPTTIFDDIPRPDRGPPAHGEPAFGYLDRSGRPEADRVRQLVDQWLARYPAPSRANLVSRFRSLNDDAHLSAFFELFIHELVTTRGHRVVDVEPKLSHTEKRPDFLVETVEGRRLYLECALATGRPAQEAAQQERLNRALKAIERAQSPRTT